MKKIEYKNIDELLNAIYPYTVNNTGGVGAKIYEREMWRVIADELDVHSKGYILPNIINLRPNENEDSMAHRLQSYEPITTPYFRNALFQVKRILSNSSVDICVGKKTGEYVGGNHFDGLKLYDFFCTEMTENVIENPNGLTAIYSPDYSKKKGINPIQFVRWEDIVYLSSDVCAFVSLLDSEITVSYSFSPVAPTANPNFVRIANYGNTSNFLSNKPVKTIGIVNAVYHIFTKNELIVASINNDIWNYQIYKHKQKQVPVFQNGGVSLNGEMYIFNSLFQHAIPFGNLALNRHSDNDAVNANYSYPHVSMTSMECGACRGSGYVTDTSPNIFGITKQKCGTCHGLGEHVVNSPNKVILRPKRKNNIDPETDNRPAVEFYSPPVEILDYSTSVWHGYLQMFKKSLCIFDKDSSAKSGYQEELQLMPLLDFMQAVGLVLYNDLEKILVAIQGYIEPNEKEVHVTRPISYHLQSENEALKTISEILNADMTDIIRRQIIRNYVTKYVGKKSHVSKYLTILESVDPFFYYSEKQKIEILANLGMTNEQYRISVAAFGVLIKMSNEDLTENKTDIEIAEMVKAEILKWEKPVPQPTA